MTREFLPIDSLSWRGMSSNDLAQILQIERNTQIAPWSRLAFEESITRSESSDEKAAHLARVLVLEGAEEKIIGFHITSCVVDEMHILNLAVEPSLQGQGLGHVLMQDIVEQAKSHHCNRVFLEVRASNEVAQSLYLKWRFKQIAERKAYYRTKGLHREDALIYVNELV